MIPARRAVAVLSFALAAAAPLVALAATPPGAAAPASSVPASSVPASSVPPGPAEPAAAPPDPRMVPDAGYIAEVERQAQQRGVRVHWVNPPEHRETRTRTLRLRGTLPARESCHGPGCPDRVRD